MNARWKQVAVVVVAAGLVGIGVAGSASATDPSGDGRHPTATSVAVPAQPGAVVGEHTYRDAVTSSPSVKADAVSTASMTCDGCRATSVAEQIVYARRAHALVADNVATAWSASCTGCSGWALSLQVVVARSAGAVTAANRSFAADVTCVQCTTSAVAVQIVVVASGARRLSAAARAEVDQLRDQLVAQLDGTPTATIGHSRSLAVPNGPGTPTPSDPLTTTASRIQSVVSADLGAVSARHDVQVSVR